jgi:hypothetical protein
MIRFGQLNAGKGRAITAELIRTVREMDVDLVLVQEPYSYGPNLGFSGGRVMHHGLGSMACIFVANPTLVVLHLAHLSSELFAVAEVSDRSGNSIVVVSSYFKFSVNILKCVEQLGKILVACRGKQIIVGADVNVQSWLWAPRGPRSGRDNPAPLEELVATHDLTVLNNSNGPATFSTNNGESHIDVTLISTGSAGRVVDWTVHLEASASDHRLITFAYRTERGHASLAPLVSESLPRRFRTKGTDWVRFDREFAEGLDRMASRPPPKDMHAAAEDLTNLMIEKAEGTIGRTTPRPPNLAPWWKPRLTRLRDAMRRARRALQAARRSLEEPPHADHPLAVTYRTTRLKFKKAISKAKKVHWREFVTEMGGNDPWGPPFRVMKLGSRPGKVMSAVRRPDGSFTNSSEESATVLLDALIPQDNESLDIDNDRFQQLRVYALLPLNTPRSAATTMSELEILFASLPIGKAPGLDCIDNALARRAWSLASHEITQLYKECMSSGIFPDCWKKGHLTVIPKAGSRPPCDPKAYRPITLLPVFGKILERLINSRIESHLSENCPISQRQFGFRPGKSTEDAIRFVIDSVESSGKDLVAGIFLDIAGAFDTAWWPLVLAKLRLKQIPGDLFALVQSYFSNREITYDSGPSLIHRRTTMGCPQGSVLGPLLWNILFDDVLSLPLPPGCTLVAYADDLLLLVGATSRPTLERAATDALGKILNWGLLNKLTFAPSKTEAVLLRGSSRVNITRRPPTVRFGQTSVRFSERVTYLGVILDDKLSFVHHAKMAVSKANSAYQRMARMAGSNWGLKPRALKVAYGAIFMGIAGYASSIWHSRVNSLTLVRRALLSGQRLALISLTKAYRTTSTDALAVLAGVLPLDLHVQVRGSITLLLRGISTTLAGVHLTPPQRSEDVPYRKTVSDIVYKTAFAAWQARWTASPKGRHTYRFFPDVFCRHQTRRLQPSHWISQFLTGHGNFAARLHEFGLIVDGPGCTCGHDHQDVEHILWDCPLMEFERAELFARVRPHTGPIGHGDLVATEANFSAFEKFAASYGERDSPDSSVDSSISIRDTQYAGTQSA